MTNASRTVVRIVAPNPSPLTLEGTNSYLIDGGQGEAICVDPGPAIPEHVEALVRSSNERGVRIRAIAVTHGHPDHWPAAPLLGRATGAPIFAHGNASFEFDYGLADGGEVSVAGATLQAIDAPGHTFDHLVFYEDGERALFTGDVILGRGTVVIAPPGGAMRAYQRTLGRLRDDFSDARVMYCGHGPTVDDAQAKIREYIAHRVQREEQLLVTLSSGPQTLPQLVARIYAAVDRRLWPAAARQILAYLVPLEEEGRVHSIELQRTATSEELAILNPDWSAVAGNDAEVARAELGASLDIETIREYALAR